MKHLLIICCVFISFSFYGQTFNGNWKSIGYGRMLSIKNQNYILKDYTSISCITNSKGNLSDLVENISLTKDTLLMKIGINNYYFVKTDTKICDKTKNKKNDPIYNFEVLAETFNKHYAFFDTRNINWQKMYNKYRSRVTHRTTELELFLIIYEMMNEFNDGHLGISVPKHIEKNALKLLLKKRTQNASSIKEINEWDLAKKVSENLLDTIKTKRNGIIRWGILKSNIGYIQINQMLGFADYGIPNTNDFNTFWSKYSSKTSKKSDAEIATDEREGVESILGEVMKDLKNTKVLIVDVRFNGGGNDEVSLKILSNFNKEKKQIGVKMAKYNDGYSKPVPIWIQGSTDAYTKPVYLLTSKASASATEIFVLGSLCLENFTKIGGFTEGIFSDILDKRLPNGWEFSLSNEIYLDHLGNNYEVKGIKPDVLLYKSNSITGQFQQIVNEVNNNIDKAVLRVLEIMNEK